MKNSWLTEYVHCSFIKTKETPTAVNKLKFGWSVYFGVYEFFSAIQNGVLAKANELGIDVITHDQNLSTAEMITGVINLLSQDIDALIIAPYNPDAMFIIADLVQDKGIPLIVIDTGYGSAIIDAFIVSDSYAGGILAGEYALDLINEHQITSKNVAIIRVEEKYKYARRRGDGFARVMLDNGFNVVAQELGNSNEIDSYLAMQRILSTHGDDLAVLFAENDRMALGAAQAIDLAGKKGQIMIIGFDGEPAALTAISEGFLQGTIAQQPFEMGELSVELALTLIEGRNITFDDRIKKEIYFEVFLIDEFGETHN
jgi:ribose transport system substrate-binding protein